MTDPWNVPLSDWLELTHKIHCGIALNVLADSVPFWTKYPRLACIQQLNNAPFPTFLLQQQSIDDSLIASTSRHPKTDEQ
jgi:hypothetical protein